MFKRLYTTFRNRFLVKDISFEDHLTDIFLSGVSVMAILSAVENITLGISPWHNIMQIFTAMACAYVLFSPIALRKKLIKPLIFFLLFVFLPFCFIHNAGIDGTTLFFVMLGMYINAMIIRGKARALLLMATVLLYGGLFTVQYLYPVLFVSYNSSFARLADYIFAFAVSSIGLFWMTRSYTNAYEMEQQKSDKLLKALEENNKKLEELSIRDPLTELFNRRHLINSLKLELKSDRNTDHPLCILMMDLDNFKEINDTYGHGFGDEALIAFARTSAKCLREYDVFARYGGEEFVALLPVCRPEDAYRIAQRICQQTELLAFRVPVHITVSIGLAVIPSGDTPKKALEHADNQLYLAKSSGRNQVACSVALDL